MSAKIHKEVFGNEITHQIEISILPDKRRHHWVIVLGFPVQEDHNESEPDDDETESHSRGPPTCWTKGDSSSEHTSAKQCKDSPEPVESSHKFAQSFLHGLSRAECFNTGNCPKSMQEEDGPQHRDKVESCPPLCLFHGQHIDSHVLPGLHIRTLNNIVAIPQVILPRTNPVGLPALNAANAIFFLLLGFS